MVLTFSGMNREGLIEKMAITKDGGTWGKGVRYVDLVGKRVRAEETASAKAYGRVHLT